MTITNTNTIQQKASNSRFLVAFVMLLLACSGAFGQTKNVTTTTAATTTEVAATTNVTNVITNDTMVASNTTSVDFALWFMGNKQVTPSNNNSNTTAKKQFITSGMSANKVMIKTFLKRVINQESNVA